MGKRFGRRALSWAAAVILCLTMVPVRAGAANAWRGIVDVIAGADYTIGLRDDGTLVFTGSDYNGAGRRIAGWKNVERMEQITSADGVNYIVGYQSDGGLILESLHDWSSERFSHPWKTQDFASWKNVEQVWISDKFCLGLHTDGTVSAIAEGDEAKRLVKSVKSWTHITQLVTDGYAMIAGLRTNGTIVATDDQALSDTARYWGGSWGPRTGWHDVESLFDHRTGIYAIRRDGTVLGMQHVDGWTNVDSLYCDSDSMYALRRDGTVATLLPTYADYGYEDPRLAEVEQWTHITQLCMAELGGAYVPVGLREDGSVCAITKMEGEDYGEWDFTGWSKVKKLYRCLDFTLGVREDGSVLITGGEFGTLEYQKEIAGWKDIDKIYVGGEMYTDHIVGLKTDGTLVAAGNNDQKQCDVRS